MRTAVVICPGRGTYNKVELGYLSQHHADKQDVFAGFDAVRRAGGQETLQELDGAASYSASRHTRGDNASALIYACTIADFLAIDRNAIDIVAVTGNSMGWYSALACAGALSLQDGFVLANTMGTLMQQHLIGGQLIYPFTDEAWRMDLKRRDELLALVRSIAEKPGHNLALSIDLGGMLVIAGNDAGLKAFERQVPRVQERFPLRLANHAAFHTYLQAPVAAAGREKLSRALFRQPSRPLIDGRGAIWWPGASDLSTLYDYTLGHQVNETYDFTQAITAAAREFAPDLFIITGPGTTMGGAVAQSLIRAQWKNMSSKVDFEAVHKAAAVIAAMGYEEQRSGLVQS